MTKEVCKWCNGEGWYKEDAAPVTVTCFCRRKIVLTSDEKLSILSKQFVRLYEAQNSWLNPSAIDHIMDDDEIDNALEIAKENL